MTNTNNETCQNTIKNKLSKYTPSIIKNNLGFIGGTTVIIGSKWAKIATVNALKSVAKNYAKSGLKSSSKVFFKSIPWVGNAIGAIDDIYQEMKISNLQTTTTSLKESQSTMEGQITDLQAGLKEAKDAKIELAEEQKRLQIELETATAENKTELELQKQAFQEALEAQDEAEQHFQGCIDATNTQIDEVKNRMKDSEAVIKILQDTSLDQAEKTEQLKGIVAKEKERIDQFEKDMSVFNDRLTESEKKLAGHEEKINDLYDKHLELEAKVKKNTADIAENKEDIAENKSNITKNTADIAENKDNIAENKQAINTETQERKAETGELRKEVNENQAQTRENKEGIAKNEDQIKNLDKKFEEEKKETQTKTHELDQKIQATQKEFATQINQSNTRTTQNTSEINRLTREQERAGKELEWERKAREEAEEQARQREAKIRTNKNNIEQLQAEIKDKSFQQAKTENKLEKLLNYTKLKEERVELKRELSELKNCSTSWVDYEAQQKCYDEILARQRASQYVYEPLPDVAPSMPITSIPSSWKKQWEELGDTEEVLQEKASWGSKAEGSDWKKWRDEIETEREEWIDTTITDNLFAGMEFVSIVDIIKKQDLIAKLAKNQKLFEEICRELGLRIPKEEPLEILTKPNPINQLNQPKPKETIASGSETNPVIAQFNSNSKDEKLNSKENDPSSSGTNQKSNQSRSNDKPKVKKPKKEAPQNKEQPKKTPPKLGDLSFRQFFQVVCLPPVLRRPGTTQALQFPWWILIWIFFLLCLFYPQIWKLLKYLNSKLSEVQCEECGKRLQEFIDEEFALCQKCLWKQQKESTKSPTNKIVDNKDLKKVETQNFIRNVLAMSANSDSEKINKLTLLKNIQTSHLPATLAEQMAINKVINTLSDAIKDQELKVLKAEINKISLTNEEKIKLITAKDKFQAEAVRTEANTRINENLTKEKTSPEPTKTEDLSQIQELLQPPKEPEPSEENSKAEESSIDEPKTNTQLENWS